MTNIIRNSGNEYTTYKPTTGDDRGDLNRNLLGTEPFRRFMID